MSILGLFVAVPVAAFDYLAHLPSLAAPACTVVTTRQGANIDLACAVVAFSGLAVLLVTLVVGKDLSKGKGRDVAVLLFLEAGALATAIGLVLADSATYVAVYDEVLDDFYDCYNPGPTTVVASHVYGLLTVVGLSLLFVLLRAFGAWTGVERPEPKRRRPNWAVPSA